MSRLAINGKSYDVQPVDDGRVELRVIAYGLVLASEEVTPTEARTLAALLRKAADEAEAGPA